MTDRSFYSTLAYQGSAVPLVDRERLERMQAGATVVPDRVLLLDLAPAEALRRLAGRSSKRAPLERRATLERVARAYRRLARRPGWTVLDARRPGPELIAEAVRALESQRPAGAPTAARRRR